MSQFIAPGTRLAELAAQSPDKIFLRQPVDGKFVDFSWKTVYQQCRQIAQALTGLGLPKGSNIAILSKNCAEWVMSDWAIQMAGMISVPIYPTANRETISHIIEESDVRLIFIGKIDNWEQLEPAIPPKLIRVSFPYPTMSCQYTWQQLVSQNEPIESPYAPQPEDIMSILYTSGSTGKPKGARLSYRAYHYAATTNASALGLKYGERLISYLPLSHITERAVILGPAVYAGTELYFVEALDTFQRDLKRARPTSFLSVPRLWTKFQSGVHMKLPPKKLRILLAIPLLGRLVAKKIRSELGLDACKLFGSGTAPIAPAVLKWYRRIGINISEGWGMTETAGLSCVNWPYNSQAIGTIGQALPGTMMRTNADGEIEIKSPGLFSGYHMQDNLSDSQMTDDGYFKTGDKGKWDNLVGGWRITGRVKDLFKTAKGKYVTPVPIEARLAANDLIEQVCVMGSGLPQPIAVVVLSEVSRSVNRAQIKVSLETTMNNVNLALENHERVSNILIAAEEWTPENNLLTPTLKIKRDLLESKYLNSIEKDFDQTVQWE